MKQLFVLLAIFVVCFGTACEDETQFEQDTQLIRDFLAENNIDAEGTSSGLFYVIERPGGDARPIPTSAVEINYIGTLLDGTVFDQSPAGQTVEFNLNSLITGWQLGLQLIGRGGKIQLYIPSRLGYGPSQAGIIPPNSVLFFDIELVDFDN